MNAASQNALKLSAWLYMHEPQLFRQLLVSLPKLQRTPYGRMGFFGDDAALFDVTVSGNTDSTGDTFVPLSDGGTLPDVTVPEDFTQDVALEPIAALDSGADAATAVPDAVSAAVATPPATDASTADASASSAGFWSGIGSGVASVAGSVAKVAGALVSPASITAAGSAATAFFNAQAKTNTTAMQQAAVNAQLARVAAGGAPAPITYVRNPVTGQLTPVYQSNQGAQALNSSLLQRLTNPSLVGGSSLSPTLLIGGGLALAIGLALLASR
jgi:hypothetical protein